MKSLLINIKNSLPYLILIIIYFLFVNIEAQNTKDNNKTTTKNIESNLNNSKNININKRITIPVIPYGQ